MANEYLHLSPSRNVIDPLIYNVFPEGNGTEDKDSNVKEKKNTQGELTSVPPSASKLYAGSSNLTGWTPLISKTYFNEQLMSFNSTPNKHFLPTSMSQNQSTQDLIDYSQGLNLTPFLTHNINMLNNGQASATSNSISHQLSNITPFHEKTLHLADFFMDSPIRKTPMKDLDTITPSKFKMGSEKKLLKHSMYHDAKGNQKRSITQIDTPPRQPHKLSITTRAVRADEIELLDDPNKENKLHGKENNDNNDNNDYDSKDEVGNSISHHKSKTKYFLQTPSKRVLRDVGNILKTPGNPTTLNKDLATAKQDPDSFKTPAKQSALVSSPSTVIMSSAVKVPVNHPILSDTDEETNEEDDENDENSHNPPSPTPNKDLKNSDLSKPVMGVFSEKKSSKSSSRSKRGPSKTSYDAPNPKNNKARMQAGMNKFQIVFTDVHTLMNKNKSKNPPANTKVNTKSKRQPANTQAHTSETTKLVRSATAPVTDSRQSQSPPQAFYSQQLPPQLHYHQHQRHILISAPSSQHLGVSSASSNHDHTMNTSKEISNISGPNNSMNTSHLNLSSGTDHTSFELGGISTTPNGKYFLDKVLEKPSPQSQNLMNQANNYFLNQQFGNMPPPVKQQHPHQNQQSQNPQNSQHPPTQRQSQMQIKPQHQNQPMMMMMMSTPQHQSVHSYSPQVYGNEMSPSAANDDTNHMGQFGYQDSFSKEMSSTPQNYSIVNMNGQSVMMPVMMTSKSNSPGRFAEMMKGAGEDNDLIEKDDNDSH